MNDLPNDDWSPMQHPEIDRYGPVRWYNTPEEALLKNEQIQSIVQQSNNNTLHSLGPSRKCFRIIYRIGSCLWMSAYSIPEALIYETSERTACELLDSDSYHCFSWEIFHMNLFVQTRWIIEWISHLTKISQCCFFTENGIKMLKPREITPIQIE